jgi:aminomethyltransferase
LGIFVSRKTALYNQHKQANAKLVDFHGWMMPLHYGSQLDEHHYVRTDAGVFDVSHMTVVDLLGTGGRNFLRYLLSNDVDRLKNTGKAFYTLMLNHRGGIVDDLIVYYRAPDNYRLVLNSATREQDLAWIGGHNEDAHAVGIQERSDLSILAVQGPKAIEKVLGLLSPSQADEVSTLQPFESVEVGDCFFARTGYTGEDGLEIILPSQKVSEFWASLLKVGIKPCGLGARDTLRLEAGMLLYGQDMNESTSPLESGLSWAVAFEPEDRLFIGREALQRQKDQGIKHKMVGLILEQKGIMRTGQTVILEGGQEGIITSGSYSPTLEKSIALARIPVNTQTNDTACFVDIRGRQIPAKITKPRFVKQGKSIVD